MSKRALTIFVAMLMAIGVYSAVANAGVEGDFTFDVVMWPTQTGAEAVEFHIDFEALLNLDFTLSGLTFSNDLAMGVAGIEHYIADIQTTLGALDMYDEFAFARPYKGCVSAYGPSKKKDAETACTPYGPVLFVKKRVSLEITIGGLTVSNLAIFEDTSFPVPTDTTTTRYTSEDQMFRFGDIIGISGTTVSGIGVSAKTGICADFLIYPASYCFDPQCKKTTAKIMEYPENIIKKKSWTETVCTNEKLEFTKEYISVTNVAPISGLVLNVHALFDPNLASPKTNFWGAVEAVYTLPMGLGTAYSWIDFFTPKDLELEEPFPVVQFQFPNLWLTWQDSNSSLYLDAGDYVWVAFFLDLQNTALENILKSKVGTGLVWMRNEIEIPISYPEPIGQLAITADWEDIDNDGRIEFEYIDFEIEKSFGEHNTFMIDAYFNENGLIGVDIEIGVSFSL